MWQGTYWRNIKFVKEEEEVSTSNGNFYWNEQYSSIWTSKVSVNAVAESSDLPFCQFTKLWKYFRIIWEFVSCDFAMRCNLPERTFTDDCETSWEFYELNNDENKSGVSVNECIWRRLDARICAWCKCAIYIAHCFDNYGGRIG